MKRPIIFCFVLFLFSSLFVFTGCYTAIFMDDRESNTSESVLSDSGVLVVRYYDYNEYQFQTGWYFGYHYSPWYRYPYQYDSWNNLWIGIHWNGYGFGYWNHWYHHPYFYPRHYYPYSDNVWKKYPIWKSEEKPDNPRRTRENDGERGINRERPKPPGSPNITNPPPKRTDGNRVRDRGEIKKEPTQQATPPPRDNTERKRGEVVRPPQTNSDRGTSSGEKPVRSNPTRERDRK